MARTILVCSLAVAATALSLAGVAVLGAHSGTPGVATVSACNLAAQQDRSANVVTGATTGDDVLTGTTGPDIIDGAAGDDIIRGRGGGDLLCGGEGDDVFIDAADNDRIRGDAGTDRVQTIDGGADRVGNATAVLAGERSGSGP